MDAGEIALTLLLGTAAGLLAFEIWGWLPLINKSLEEAVLRMRDEDTDNNVPEKFEDRRVSGLVIATVHFTSALITRDRSKTRDFHMASRGIALSAIFSMTYIASSFLVGGAPADLTSIVSQVAALGAVGGFAGYVVSLVVRFIDDRRPE